jgi:hypothetical protein
VSTPDYDIHLDNRRFDSMWEDLGGSGVPFEEDLEDIERAIEETLGSPKARKKRRKTA